MSFETSLFFIAYDVFFFVSSDSLDSPSLLSLSPRSTTCIGGLLGESSGTVVDGMGML